MRASHLNKGSCNYAGLNKYEKAVLEHSFIEAMIYGVRDQLFKSYNIDVDIQKMVTLEEIIKRTKVSSQSG